MGSGSEVGALGVVLLLNEEFLLGLHDLKQVVLAFGLLVRLCFRQGALRAAHQSRVECTRSHSAVAGLHLEQRSLAHTFLRLVHRAHRRDWLNLASSEDLLELSRVELGGQVILCGQLIVHVVLDFSCEANPKVVLHVENTFCFLSVCFSDGRWI